jgi:hypothetical protein
MISGVRASSIRIESTSSTIALHAILDAEGQVVAQVVEAELVVRAVGDVGGVGGPLLLGGLARLHDADRESEETEDGAHPFRVATGEVLVDRDDVCAGAGQRVQVRGQRRDQRLAFAGTHLGDLAVVQHHAADELHVEVPETKRSARSLAYHCECLRQQVVHGLAGGELVAELTRLVGKIRVGQGLQGRLERVDPADRSGVLTDEPLVAATK